MPDRRERLLSRQNTAALNGQSREAVLTAAQSELQMLMLRPRITRNIAGSEPLSADEQIELDAAFTLMMRSREFSWLQYQDGMIDEFAKSKDTNQIFSASSTWADRRADLD